MTRKGVFFLAFELVHIEFQGLCQQTHFVPKCHLPPTPGGFSCARENPGEMEDYMAFFASAITTLQTLVIALGAGLGVWGVVNLLEGYGSDNPGSNAHVR